MDWLNYHHLLYFWTVAKEGTVSAAAERLHLSRPTVTAQVRALEKAFGQPLFAKRGRRLALTDFGAQVLGYADEIFRIGNDLRLLARGIERGRRQRFTVGLPDVMSKLMAFRLIQPAAQMRDSIHLVCREGKLEELLAELALNRLDIVLSDSPAAPSFDIRAHNHKLGETGITFFAAPPLASKHRKDFPKSLHEAPMILPAEKTAVRRDINQWASRIGAQPDIIGELEDSALLKVFGEAGLGIFPAPTAIESEVKRRFQVEVVGRVDGIRDEYYAISLESKLRHPAVLAIYERAKGLFVSSRKAPRKKSARNAM